MDEMLKPTSRHDIWRLFQARMWREYAQQWDRAGLSRDWVEKVLCVSRAECLNRARAALSAPEQP